MRARGHHRTGGCCGPEKAGKAGMISGFGCCRIEAVVSVDERGQIVLPKDVRERAGIKARDKLALVMHGPSGSVCCISLIKAEHLAESMRTMLGPMMKEIFG